MTHSPDTRHCQLGVAFGEESFLYSFPEGHPFNKSRLNPFSSNLRRLAKEKNNYIKILTPRSATEKDLLLFHSEKYVNFVRESSKRGTGYLDYGDTPSFKGVFEASLFSVGGTLLGLEQIMSHHFDHFFNPVGGLHHARRDRAGGFCVFNDCAIAIVCALEKFGIGRIAYVDIDAHHGDGVFYGFETDPRVIICDIHEDGKFLYPGTGSSSETGKGDAVGTKLNLPLPPGSGDNQFLESFSKIESFLVKFKPEIIFFQCGADGLEGDPLTHLRYSSKTHGFAAERLHTLSHSLCSGRLLAMGGGGYNSRNVNDAWTEVTTRLTT